MQMVKIEKRDLVFLASITDYAYRKGRPVHFSVDGGGLKVKLGQAMWTAPMGEPYMRG